MFEWLINIPGPQFLWIFPLVAAGVAGFVLLLQRFDSTAFDESSTPPDLNTLEIAVLSGGHKQAMELTLYELYREGCLSFNKNNWVTVSKAPQSMPPTLLPLGRKLYKEIQTVQYLADLNRKSKVKKACASILNPVSEKLQELRLLKNTGDWQRDLMVFLAGLFIWLSFGGAKLFFGLTRNKPSGYLVFELLIALIFYIVLAYPRRQKPTALGRRILGQIRETLQPARTNFRKSGKAAKAQSTLLMAAFGVMAFAHSPFVQPFRSAYYASTLADSSGGGCSGGGGGCGSD